MHRSGLLGAAVVVLSCVLGSCDQLTGTQEGKLWTIEQTKGGDAPRLVLKTQCTGSDASGKSFPVEVEVAGTGGSDWAANVMRQSLEMKMVFVGGPVVPEVEVIAVPDGQRRSTLGPGSPGSEVRKTASGSTTCPTLVAFPAAAFVKAMVGSDHVDVTAGSVKFTLNDEQVRALAELMRRLDRTAPK